VHHGILRNSESGSVGGRDFDGRHATVAELLGEKEYRSTLCGKWHVGTELEPSACGFEGVFYPGYGYPDEHAHYLEYLKGLGCEFELAKKFYGRYPDGSPGPLLSAVQRGPDEASIPHYIGNQAIDAMRIAAKENRPFLVRCDFWGPHAPYVIPGRYAEMYDPREIPEWPNFLDSLEGKPSIQRTMKKYWGVRDFGWREWSRLVAMCYGYVTLIDDQVGRLLGALDELGLADDTAVFYTSDHGGMVGAHGLCDKGPHLYDEEIRIPLVARVPGAAEGTRSNAVAYNMDLMPTILDIAGADVPDDLDALSLMPVVRGEVDKVREPVAYVEFHGHQGPYSQRLIYADDVKYVFNAPDGDELYDLAADPGELKNLIDDPDYAAVLTQMKRRLLDFIIGTDDPIRRFFEHSRSVGS
jgi:arylsulfatase A-like enzyme